MTDTLKSICEQCTHLNTPQLDFVPAEFSQHKGIIRRDLQELVSAASVENAKTVSILSGCIFEAILFTLINWQAPYIADRRGEFEFDPTMSLQDYMRVFNRWLRSLLPGVELPDSIARHRDLIHINRELSAPEDICVEASREMLRMLDALLAQLARFGQGSP